MAGSFVRRLVFCALVFLCANRVAANDSAAALIKRVVPGYADQFIVESIAPENGKDVFEIESRAGKIVLRGNNGVSVGSALGWYLKYSCNCQLSWCGDQMNLPATLPAVTEKVRIVSPYKYRYYFNYCTLGYSAPWWDWNRWEREIDWMALNGINMPLAITGQEAAWRAALRQFKMSDEQISSYLTGPAFLPWHFMANLDGHGGPLPASWIDSHQELGRKIADRERELGMTPVLQGFAGHIPEAFKTLYPQAKFHQLDNWTLFPGTCMLDPQDPLFEKFALAFMTEQEKLFGSTRFFAADPFHENKATFATDDFRTITGERVLAAMKKFDPQAVWVMQSWSMQKPVVKNIPVGGLLVLDLWSDYGSRRVSTKGFYGHPYVWCMLHNFGQNPELFGKLDVIASGPIETLKDSTINPPSGVGLGMEGINQNYIVYDLMTEMAFHSEKFDVAQWVRNYVKRRYGKDDSKQQEAWRLLSESVYAIPQTVGHAIPSGLSTRPSLGALSAMNVEAKLFGYDPLKLLNAWELLNESADGACPQTLLYDLADIGRQNLANLSRQLRLEVLQAYKANDKEKLHLTGQRYLELLADMDRLLATKSEFLLGPWVESAKAWGTNDAERKLYAYNAKNIVTSWTSPEQDDLHEYARKEWAGLIRDYYAPRWALLFSQMEKSLGQTFDSKKFLQDVILLERAWLDSTNSYSTVPSGDTVAISRELFAKYRTKMEQTFRRECPSLTTDCKVTATGSKDSNSLRQINDGFSSDPKRHSAIDPEKDEPVWWQVDFAKSVPVGRVVVVPYFGDGRSYGYIVQISTDGKKWQKVADCPDNKVPATAQGYSCSFAPQKIRYLRVTLTHNSANKARHLVELLAFPE